MSMIQQLFIGYDDGDVDTNAAGPHMRELIAQRYSRRDALRGGLSTMTAAVFGGALLSACGEDGGSARGVEISAGGAASATGGKMVTLTGSVVSGVASGSSWTQTAGPAVTLANAPNGVATFIAPGVASPTPLAFQYEATSSDGIRSQASTTVTVAPAVLDFTAVAKSREDLVAVPAGYSVTVLYRLGDPINGTVGAYANNGSDTNFAARAGDHHDGMSWFGLSSAGAPDPAGSTRGLLVLNHENITQSFLHMGGPTTVNGARPEAEAIKEIEAHGVSVIEVARTDGSWAYVPASTFNRRITPLTPMAINGPARGVAAMRTLYSPTGVAGRGTINNCANGYMPWGTYLTNEENWAGYFRREAGDVAARGGATARANVSLARYGIGEGRGGTYGWATVVPADASSTNFARWNVTVRATAAADGSGDFRNEAFQFGWVVEIDPYTQTSTPRKRTALGRMNHEGCWAGRVFAGVRPAFYMGDDAQNEYIYKFVSATPWATADATPADRLATVDKYLDAGTLYVARLNADGSGQWLPLVFGQGPLTAANAAYAFADQADVLINARLAADALGATRMDRPEWTAVSPLTGEMYCTLTNNSSRTPATTDAANPRAYVDPKLPQGDTVNADPPTTAQATRGNANGHIVRMRETGDSTEATSFTWDIYAFGSGADLSPQNINLSGLDATNDFSSPDGLWFGRASNAQGQATPVLWIQTDDGAYTDVTNCMLLAAMPGSVGDGGARTVNNTLTTAANVTTSSATATRIGKAPGTQLRRFLVGPKECEITGIDTTPDGRALFVNIQHPGENGSLAAITSNWPANQTTGTVSASGPRPRSATIVITKNDGGVVGL